MLRELAESDAPRLFEYESQPDFARFMSGYCATLDGAYEYVRGILVETQEVPRLVFDFAVTVRGDDRIVGRAGMKRDADPRSAMLWYSLDPAVQGNGYATEAARAVMTMAFEELKLHRVWADADPRNPASLRVMERLGMRKEGHLVENICIRDEWCDSVIYAMLRREWETR